MKYQPAVKTYWLSGYKLSYDVMMCIHTGEGFTRYYFHDKTPGNFVMFICKTSDKNEMLFDIEYHWSINDKFSGMDSVKGIKVPQIMPIIGNILEVAATEGFGK